MSRKRLSAEFDSLMAAAFPGGVSPRQRLEWRMAFFAGARAIHLLLMKGLSPDSEVTPADEAMLADLIDELNEFGDEIGLSAPTAGHA